MTAIPPPSFDPQRLKALLAGPPALKLAVAESVTCGGLQQRIGRISGASEFFLGGITAYDAAQKFAHLGVDDAEARAVNCVSAKVAEQMARGVCVLFNADLGIATTGYAEPNAKWRADHPHAFWAVARRDTQFAHPVQSGRIDCPGATRAEAQDRICEAVLAEFLRLLGDLRNERH